MGAGIRQPQRPHIKKFLQVKQFVFIDVFVRSPAYNKLKTHTKAGGRASRVCRFKTNSKILGGGKILPFCLKRKSKNQEKKTDYKSLSAY